MCALRQVPVAVVGLSGGDIEQNSGVGKSCFCSRFVLPAYDDYEAVKESLSSCISEADFLQREVNRCHFLYFTPTTREQIEFHVVEQTTLVRDTTLRPFSETAKYADRATRLSLRSDGKVAFTSRDHIGTLSDTKWFPSELFENVGIKGFICVFDPTLHGQTLEDQVMLACDLIANIQSKKKVPVVLVVSKCDRIEQASDVGVNYARDIARRYSVPIMYTSAHENMNVTETFLLLANLMIKKFPSKTCRADTADYVYTAVENHRQKLQALDKTYNELLEALVNGLYVTWSFVEVRLIGKIEYENFKSAFGMEQAKVAFKIRVLLTALRTSSEVLATLTEDPASVGQDKVVRDLLLDHEDIGYGWYLLLLGFLLHAHFPSFLFLFVFDWI